MKKLLTILLFICLPCFGANVDVAFSPDQGAEALILETIATAQKEIRVAAYSFTSPQITKALQEARRRGVDIKVVVDEKGNKSKASKAAMNFLVNANIPVRTISAYRIHHDKYMVIDGQTVETGSFNYSQSAARNNSENVVVIRNNADVANQYLQHWQSRWEKGKDWVSEY